MSSYYERRFTEECIQRQKKKSIMTECNQTFTYCIFFTKMCSKASLKSQNSFFGSTNWIYYDRYVSYLMWNFNLDSLFGMTHGMNNFSGEQKRCYQRDTNVFLATLATQSHHLEPVIASMLQCLNSLSILDDLSVTSMIGCNRWAALLKGCGSH